MNQVTVVLAYLKACELAEKLSAKSVTEVSVGMLDGKFHLVDGEDGASKSPLFDTIEELNAFTVGMLTGFFIVESNMSRDKCQKAEATQKPQDTVAAGESRVAGETCEVRVHRVAKGSPLHEALEAIERLVEGQQ